MIRKLVLIGALALAGFAAGCATMPTYPSSAPRPPVAAALPRPMHAYVGVPRAPLLSELQVCNSWGSNLGLVGERGESLDYTPYIYTAAGPLLRTPTAGACMSSGFGWRNAASGGGREHTGLDLANPNGAYIYAAADARVRSYGMSGGYGLYVELDHGQGVRTFYAHLAEINPALRQGAHVVAGEPIGFMGATGNASGVHLHYEVLIDDLRVDPLHYGVQPPLS